MRRKFKKTFGTVTNVMDPHYFANPDPNQIKIRIRLKKVDPEPDPDTHQFSDNKP
jgi:hypothetical protein